MFSCEISTFLLSWRGFLLEGRRVWHAHHRRTLVGTRSGYLLPTTISQFGQLTRATSLLHTIFERGGQVWGFGLGNFPTTREWGQSYSQWRPGVLSNYFFVRVRRVHFARRLVKAIRAGHHGPRRGRRRYRRGGRRLSTQWGRLRRRGSLPVSVYHLERQRRAACYLGYSRGIHKFARRALSTTITSPTVNWRETTGWWASPYYSWVRVRYLRKWWRTAHRVGVAARTTTPHGWFRAGGIRGLVRWAVRAYFSRVVTTRGRRRTNRLLPQNYAVWYPGRRTLQTATRRIATRRIVVARSHGRRRLNARVMTRITQWPVGWPAAGVAGGAGLVGTNVVHEVQSAGLPLIYFGGPSAVPTAVVWHVHWNQQPASLWGVTYLLTGVWRSAHRAGVLHMVWRRLTYGW